MIALVPNSYGALREHNTCHSKQDGKFCSGKGGQSYDPASFRLKRGQTARGMVVNAENVPVTRAQRLVNGTATAKDVLSTFNLKRVGRFWWDTDASAAPFEYSYGEEPLSKWMGDATRGKVGGEIQLVLVGKRPKYARFDEWDSSLPDGTEIHLSDAFYNAGGGWFRVPLSHKAVVG